MRKRIGEYLIQAGLITDADLRAALEEHRRSGEPLGVVLVRLTLVTEQQVAKALASQLDFPYVDPTEEPPEAAAIELIPKTVALARVCVVLKRRQNELTVAMADPLLFSVVQDLSHGQGQLVLLGLDHHADPIQRHVLGNQHDRRGLGWVFGGIDVRKTELVGEGFGDLLLCGEVQLDQRGAHTFPGTSVLHEGRLQIVLADETRLDKALADLSSHVTVRRGNFSSETRPVVDECVSVRGSNDGLRR